MTFRTKNMTRRNVRINFNFIPKHARTPVEEKIETDEAIAEVNRAALIWLYTEGGSNDPR